jgi:elongator complex protein 1
MKVNTICDAVREILESKDSKKYLQSIITTYVKKSPPELESALNFLAKLKGNNEIVSLVLAYLLLIFYLFYLFYFILNY